MNFNDFFERFPFTNWVITYEVLDDYFNVMREGTMVIRTKTCEEALNEFMTTRPTKRAQVKTIGLAT